MGLQDRDWYWKDRASREQNLGPAAGPAPAPVDLVLSFRPPSRARADSWVVAAAWAGAAVLVLVATILFAQWRNQVAAERMVNRSLESLRQVTREAAEDERRAAAQQALLQAEHQRREAARIEAIREQERTREAAVLVATQEAARKNAAWEKFYRPSARCNDAATVNCANEFIRTRRAFEARYEAGSLR